MWVQLRMHKKQQEDLSQTWKQCCPLSKETKEYSLINAAVENRVLRQDKKEENKVVLGILEEQLPP